eukprot:6205331-Pleurochrysis_carterae.AAC.5
MPAQHRRLLRKACESILYPGVEACNQSTGYVTSSVPRPICLIRNSVSVYRHPWIRGGKKTWIPLTTSYRYPYSILLCCMLLG